MAISRERAFGLFGDLLAEGLRPCLVGFRAQDGSPAAAYWPAGSEGFFLSARLESGQEAGFAIDKLTRMHELAERRGLTAWFSGTESDDDEGVVYGMRVVFEMPRGKSYTGASGEYEYGASES